MLNSEYFIFDTDYLNLESNKKHKMPNELLGFLIFVIYVLVRWWPLLLESKESTQES